MAVIKVKAWNYMLQKDLNVQLDGKSFFVVGDSETGKSTFLQIIEESLMLKPFTKNPISDGEKEGGIEVTHDFGDGNLYTVRRTFSRDNKKLRRFEIIDQHGKSEALQPVLERIFGKAFFNTYFDFKTYFYEKRTEKERFEYFIKAVGGEQVLTNNTKYNRKNESRDNVGGQRITYKSLLSQSPINPETLESDFAHFMQEKTIADADKAYNEVLQELKDREALELELQVIYEQNNKFIEAEKRVPEIDLEVAELEKQIKALKAEKKASQKFIKDFPADFELQAEKEMELSKVDELNREVQERADLVYDDTLREVHVFLSQKQEFKTGLGYLEKLKELNEEWEKLDQEMKGLKEENNKIIQDRVPIPEITIDNTRILYDGKEMCFPHVSTGKAVRIASQIQRALNPKGNNLIVIPDGGSLGSKLFEVIEECKNFDVQYIVEVTEMKQKFKIQMEEEFLKKLA
jgi:hypothetical protein